MINPIKFHFHSSKLKYNQSSDCALYRHGEKMTIPACPLFSTNAIDFFPRPTRGELRWFPSYARGSPGGNVLTVGSLQLPAIPHSQGPGWDLHVNHPHRRCGDEGAPAVDLTDPNPHPPPHTHQASKCHCSVRCSVSTAVTSRWVSSLAPEDSVSRRRGCSAPFSVILPCLLLCWQADSQKPLIQPAGYESSALHKYYREFFLFFVFWIAALHTFILFN